ncbi:APC family permease [Methanofollis aquaemaris]|uniref:APC family permease n=1 Tax=Methanofollis aquaemaris TaxID=126734 RepID=A0A8A3S1H9_9EURY|nr:APC family permease [Methanofollis aquaemaris]QSZ66208.1 APC family permease [Methanofollis aquaemaris]
MAEQLDRILNMRDLLAFGIITMVPIAPMGIYGIVAVLSEGHVPLVYLLAAIVMSVTAWVYGQCSYRFPEAGSAYAYVRETFGPHIGFVAGWAILLDYILIPGLVVLVSALWLEAATGVAFYFWALAFLIPTTILNIIGIKQAARVTMALFFFEIAVFAIFVIVAIAKIITDPSLSFTLAPFYNPETFSAGAILSGASVAVLSFLGFDMMTTLAEETVEARKVVSKAVVMVIPLIAFFFVSLTYFGAVIHPGATFEDPDVAFFFIAQEAGGDWLQILAMLGTVIAWGVGDCLAAQASVSRVLFSMGRQGHIPAAFARLHPKYKTPYISIVTVAAVTGVLLYVLTLQDLSSLVNFGALTAFMLLHLSLAYRFVKIEGTPKLAVIPAIGFLLTGAIWYGLDIFAKEIGFIWVIIGIVYLAFITRGFKVKTTLPVE